MAPITLELSEAPVVSRADLSRRRGASSPASAPASPLAVDRTDIRFWNVAPNLVRIQVTVHNMSDRWSLEQPIWLQAAPLGAFVPWRDLGEIAVPMIAPGGSTRVEMVARAPTPTPLGDFSRVPPRRLLTALASDDESRDDRPALRNLARGILSLGVRDRDDRVADAPELPADPMQLLGRPSMHWAGNFNVLVGSKAVERHLAQGVRIYPGAKNIAVFAVGNQPDEYKFEVSGTGSAWNVTIYDSMHCTALFNLRPYASPIRLGQWTHFATTTMVMLGVSPPADCAEGSVNIHVRQRSTDRDAVVEFSLDPRAAGAGCYTI